MYPADHSLGDTLHEAIQSIPQADKDALRDRIVSNIYEHAESIAKKVVRHESSENATWDRRIDDVLTSPLWGFPIMLALLGVVLWLTVVGANYPSQVLAAGLFYLEDKFVVFLKIIGAPSWLQGMLAMGMYRGLAWVVSVMLPPMAIFFPLFTLLEDLGYLPRVAFNLDHLFRKAGVHGKQSLTMSMGFGCNAAGVIACRIIESPRERLIAILTNNFIPCNGRFPTLIIMANIFMGGVVAGTYSSVLASVIVTCLVLFGITVSLMTSWLLSRTILRGLPSFFVLELPPYRKPQLGRILIRSVLDRTVFVLGRAVAVAAPAGIITWILANTYVADYSIMHHAAKWLHPLGYALGLDGFILLAFILGFPANEIVFPIALMGYLSGGAMIKLDNLVVLRNLLVISHGWTWLTAMSMMLFSILHYPCGTTILTIMKETRSLKWTTIAAIMPLAIAILVNFGFAQLVRFLGLV